MSNFITKITKKALILLDNLVPYIVLLATLNWIIAPHLAIAQGLDIPNNNQLPYQNGKNEIISDDFSYLSGLPVTETGKTKDPRYTIKVKVTAYNSAPGQTDNTPCITASGLDVCERYAQGAEDIVATNYLHLPFGTKVEFPDLYPGKIFLVHDRMNKRYTKTFDVWLADYGQAKTFGVKYTNVNIF